MLALPATDVGETVHQTAQRVAQALHAKKKNCRRLSWQKIALFSAFSSNTSERHKLPLYHPCQLPHRCQEQPRGHLERRWLNLFDRICRRMQVGRTDTQPNGREPLAHKLALI